MKYTNIQNLRFQDWLRSYRSHGSYQSFFLQVQALPANIPAYIHNMQGVLPTDSQGARMCVCAFECGCVCGSVRMHICICCIYTYACMSANKCISSLSIIQKRTDTRLWLGVCSLAAPSNFYYKPISEGMEAEQKKKSKRFFVPKNCTILGCFHPLLWAAIYKNHWCPDCSCVLSSCTFNFDYKLISYSLQDPRNKTACAIIIVEFACQHQFV